MSFADLHDGSSPTSHLRTHSSAYHAQFFGDSPPRNREAAFAASNSHNVLGSPVRWDEWTHTLESPGAPMRDPVHDSPGAFYGSGTAAFDFHHLGELQQNGASAGEHNPFQTTPENGSRRRTRSQRNAWSSEERRDVLESPGRLRPSAFKLPNGNSSQHASPADLSRNSPLFPNGLPSPFDQPPATSAAPHMLTIDPSRSLHASAPPSATLPPEPTSPSPSSSSDFDAMDEDGDAGSVYGGDGGVMPVAPTFRSASTPSRSSSTRRQSSMSPKKQRGTSRKLANSDRKAICLYREQHPTMKQDHIGEIFGVERSTVSKILKNKDKWLAIKDDDAEESTLYEEDEDDSSTIATSARLHQSPMPSPVTSTMRISHASNSASRPQLQQQQSSSSESSFSDLRSSQSHTKMASKLDKAPPTPAPVPQEASTTPLLMRRPCYPEVPMTGGRFILIDTNVAKWARALAESGIDIEDSDIQQRALEIAQETNPSTNFKASITWLEGFKHRAGIAEGTFLDILEKRRAADTPESVSERAMRKRAAASNKKRSKHMSEAEHGIDRAPNPSSMDIDMHTPDRVGEQSIDSETTPKTHQHQHHARGSEDYHNSSMLNTSQLGQPREKENPFIQDGSNTGRTVSMSRSSSRQHSALSQSGSFSSVNDSPFPFQSPFHSQAMMVSNSSPPFAFPGDPRVLPNSGANSPLSQSRAVQQQQQQQHGRSGSTASNNSVYSSLTNFSSQPTSSTPLSASLYASSSFSTASSSQLSSASLPSTPATGYFSQGFEQQQPLAGKPLQASSQMSMSQSASSMQQQHTPPPSAFPHLPGQPVRRATFSGDGPPQLAVSTNVGRPGAPPMRQQPSVTFEQAFSSLQLALDFLSSSQGHGIVEAEELAALADVQAKMSRSQAGSRPASASPAVSERSFSSQPVDPSPASAASAAAAAAAARSIAASSPAFGGPTRNARSHSLSRSASAKAASSPSAMSAFSNVSGPTVFSASSGLSGGNKHQRVKLGRTQSTSSINTVGLSSLTALTSTSTGPHAARRHHHQQQQSLPSFQPSTRQQQQHRHQEWQ